MTEKVIARGADLKSLVAVMEQQPAGKGFDIELNYSRSLSAAELAEIQTKIAAYGTASLSSGGKTLKIRYTPKDSDGVGLLPLILLIPLLIGAGLLSWRILTQVSAVMAAIQSIPTIAWIAGSVVLLGGMYYIFFGGKKQIITRTIGKLKG